jgi:hypothetical protein
VIPPPSHAVVHGDENTKVHDQTEQYILETSLDIRTPTREPKRWGCEAIAH